MSLRLSFVVSRAASAPLCSITGPLVVTRSTPISWARMPARVVLPSPGGPQSRMWSRGSPRLRAASTKTRRFSLCLVCPTYSAKVFGRRVRSKPESSPCAVPSSARDAAGCCSSGRGGAAGRFGIARRSELGEVVPDGRQRQHLAREAGAHDRAGHPVDDGGLLGLGD